LADGNQGVPSQIGLALCVCEIYGVVMAQDRASESRKLEIKKYPNRRYYDATHSRHLTLDEIRSLIQQGYDIRVVDARTSADITAQVLTQLILELDTSKLDSLPVPLLIRLIRMNDQLIKDFIEKYFNQALQSFIDYQRSLEEQIRRTHDLPAMLPSVSAWAKAMLQPFAVALGQTSQNSETTRPAQSAPLTEKTLAEQLKDLERQIAELKRDRTRNPAKRRPRRPAK
jgi:polyhydroxyalkanoate synthesis repressor PhaR